jgi:hypothetical protein
VEQGVRASPTLPFAKGDMVSVLDERWHYIRNNGTRQEQLFDLTADRAELLDRARERGSDTVIARFRDAIRALVAREARHPGAGPVAAGQGRGA